MSMVYGEKSSYSDSEADEVEVRSTVRMRLNELNSYWSDQYEKSDEDLEFASSDQWESSVRKERGLDNRPTLVLNFTRAIINRVVNPLRLNPMGVRINSESEEFTELLTGIFSEIEHRSRAQEAYDIAFENAVTCGIGWVRIGLDYEDDESVEQKICIEPVRNPLGCYIDPFADAVDGSDAKYAVTVGHLDKDLAVKKWGEEVAQGQMAGINVYEYWTVPDNSVCDLTYYEVIEEQKPRYWYSDGSYSDEEIEGLEYIQKRDVNHKYVKACRFIGQKLVQESKIPIPFVPLVPVFGDRLHTNTQARIRWAGLVHWLRDSQKMVNYYASQELELTSAAPKNPWIIADGQLENHEEDWATANVRNHAFLAYTPTALNGQPVPPPQRTDNTAQTQGLIASRQQSQVDMGRATGIFDSMLGEYQGAQDSGTSILMRTNQGEIATAQYMQNFRQSLEQVGRVIMWLMPYAYDTPRRIGIRDEQGNRQTINAKLSEVITPVVLRDMDIEIYAGPAYESKRKESISAILQIAQIMPDKMGVMADLLVKQLDSPGSTEIAQRLEKLLPPEITGQVDPAQLQAQMQALQAENMQLKTALTKTQFEAMDNDKDRQISLAKEIIKSETALAKERMSQTGLDERAAASIEADSDKQIKDIVSRTQQQIMDIEAKAQEQMRSIQGEVAKASAPQVKIDLSAQPMGDAGL